MWIHICFLSGFYEEQWEHAQQCPAHWHTRIQWVSILQLSVILHPSRGLVLHCFNFCFFSGFYEEQWEHAQQAANGEA